MNRTYIIAEAGVNHNGDIDMAERLIDKAVDAEVDAVKFQTFSAERICSVTASKAEYQKKTTPSDESQLQMLKKLELGRPDHDRLISYCKKKKIEFISSPFDLESIDLLISSGLRTIKIPSGEMTNLPYLEKIGAAGKQIILSTGMADIHEIESALDILVHAGTSLYRITLLHCCTEYPAPMESINLQAIKTMADKFSGTRIGYSDHSQGIEVAIAAVAMGARVIEKHFTLDKTMDGPDHRASLDPDELKGMVCAIRNIEKALGDGIKRPTPAEIKNRKIVRKSIVALKKIKKGEKFSHFNITTKRPGNGISPLEWNNVMGKKARQNFIQDELIVL